jgi:heme exporter protein D
MLWIWLAVVVVCLVILGSAALSLLGRLSVLQHAAVRLQRRQEEAAKLQEGVAELERSALALQQRAEVTQGRIVTIQAGLGTGDR